MKARFGFRLHRPRHPLARAALACVAVGLLALFSALVLLIVLAVALGWAARRLVAQLAGGGRGDAAPARHRPRAGGTVLEGEYRVVGPGSDCPAR